VSAHSRVFGAVDGGGGLGHPAARLAMAIAVDKARQTGAGIVPVRNSAHFRRLRRSTR